MATAQLPLRAELPTFRAASAAALVAPADTNPFLIIEAPASNTAKIRRVRLHGLSKAAVENVVIVCNKTSTAATLVGTGAFVALTQLALDTSNALASATGALSSCKTCATAAPNNSVTGTIVGKLGVRVVCVETASPLTKTPLPVVEFLFGENTECGPAVLHPNAGGAPQGLSFAFLAAPTGAVTMYVEVEWTEQN